MENNTQNPISESANVAPIAPVESNEEPLYEEESESFFSRFGGIFKILVVIVLLVVVGIGGFFLFNFFFGKKSTEQVTLTYWGLWEDEKIMRSVLSEFEKENPNISITYIKQDPKQYRDRLSTRIQKGTGPDIFRFHNSWLPMLSSDLLALPQEVITKQQLEKDYYPTVAKDVTANGAIYGIPLEIDTLSLFVNKELFDAQGLSAPTTWDEFLNAARSLTVPDPETGKIKTAGAAIGTYDNIEHAPDILSLLFVQNGANMNDLMGTKADASEALDFYTLFAKGENKVWDETLDNSLLGFAAGKVGMMFGYSWDVLLIKAMSPDLSFEVYPVPRLPGQNKTIASYWVEGVSSKTKHPKEAFMLMQFLKKKETQQKLFSESAKTRPFGEPYSRVELSDSLRSNKLVFPFVSQGPQALSSYFVSDTQDDGINSQMNAYLGNAVRSALSNSSSESSVEALANGVSQVLSQYVPSPAAKK